MLTGKGAGRWSGRVGLGPSHPPSTSPGLMKWRPSSVVATLPRSLDARNFPGIGQGQIFGLEDAEDRAIQSDLGSVLECTPFVRFPACISSGCFAPRCIRAAHPFLFCRAQLCPARSNTAMSSFFICIMACIALGCLINSAIRAGVTCQQRPNLSLSQPQAISLPPSVNFSQ
jgi:hypothetical protein